MIRRMLTIATASALVLITAGCSSPSGVASGTDVDWTTPPDASKIAEQAGVITTYGLPDSWANYGELLATFCEQNGADCTHADTDMASSEAIQRYNAEKGNPVGFFNDIGGLWGPVAEDIGVTSGYLPKLVSELSPGQYAETGGWVNSFTGVMGYLVNPAVAPVPKTWEDLLSDDYAGGKIASSALMGPTGGSEQAAILSIALARGGDVGNLDAAWDYLNELYATGNISSAPSSLDSLIRGEYGIYLQYDFNAIAAIEEAATQGVELVYVVPEDGSIYMPSSLLTNGYNTEHMDFIKGFMDFTISDEGQLLFADFGARPIRYVNGDLEIPQERKSRWLPDEMFKNTQVIDPGDIDPEVLISEYNEKAKG